MRGQTVITMFVFLPVAFSTATLATTLGALFKQVQADFAADLLFSQPARSVQHCVLMCAGTPSCDRAILSEGRCQGHRWSRKCDGVTTLIWERERTITNVTFGKPAVQDSTFPVPDVDAGQAVDGDRTFDHCSMTEISSVPHWWQVDLLDTYIVFSVTIDNTVFGAAQPNVSVHVYTEDPQTSPGMAGSLCHSQDGEAGDPLQVLPCSNATAPGRFLRITTTSTALIMCEVEAEACLLSP